MALPRAPTLRPVGTSTRLLPRPQRLCGASRVLPDGARRCGHLHELTQEPFQLFSPSPQQQKGNQQLLSPYKPLASPLFSKPVTNPAVQLRICTFLVGHGHRMTRAATLSTKPSNTQAKAGPPPCAVTTAPARMLTAVGGTGWSPRRAGGLQVQPQKHLRGDSLPQSCQPPGWRCHLCRGGEAGTPCHPGTS